MSSGGNKNSPLPASCRQARHWMASPRLIYGRTWPWPRLSSPIWTRRSGSSVVLFNELWPLIHYSLSLLCSARSPPRFVCCLPVWRSFIVGQTASLQPRRNVGGKVSKVHVAQVARSVVAREATDSSKDSFEDSFEDGDKDSDKGQDEDERTGEHEILIAPPSGSAAGQSSGQPSLGATHDKLGAIGSRMHR